jgi:hypothetical protein
MVLTLKYLQKRDNAPKILDLQDIGGSKQVPMWSRWLLDGLGLGLLLVSSGLEK